MAKRVLVVQSIHEAGLERLRAREDVAFEITTRSGERELIEQLHGVHAITVRTARITRAVIAAADSLEIVSRHGVGYDAVDIEACAERGIPVTVTPGANSTSVAEHAMSMILALAKRALPYDRAVREQRFYEARNSLRARDVEGRHLLIVGFGRIGSRLAPRAQAFGMRVSAYDPYVDANVIVAAGCEVVTDLAAALPEVDVLSAHCPLTAETEGMFGAAEFERLRPSALVVNTARGGIVDETALANALACGSLGGAGLDVFVGEPDPPARDHPLLGFDNVIVSPHSAGVSLEASIRTAEYTVQNVLDCFDGRLDEAVVVNAARLRSRA